MMWIEGVIMVLGLGFGVSFTAFFVSIIGLSIFSIEEVPLQKHEFTKPLSSKRFERIGERYHAMDRLERSSHLGRFADASARYMTFFGIALAATAGLSAILSP